MTILDQLGLRLDPFGPANVASGFGIAAPVSTVAEKLLDAVRRGDPLTVLAGRPGMGKSLALSLVEAAARADGLDVRTVARGDMAHGALGAGAQLLIIDEADTINAATLTALAPGRPNAAAAAMLFAATRPELHRLSGGVLTTIIDLRPLDPSEAADFLLARAAHAGRPDLFEPAALDTIIGAGRGSPRLLRVLAGAAMYQAAGDEATRISAAHASLAATMHGSLIGGPERKVRVSVAANDVVPFARPAEGGHPTDNLVPLIARRSPARRRRGGAMPLAASVALAALFLPAFFSSGPSDEPFAGGQARARATAGPVQFATAAFAGGTANAAVPFRMDGQPSAVWSTPLKVAAILPLAPVRAEVRTATAALDRGVLPGRVQAPDVGPMPTTIAIARPSPNPVAGGDRTLIAGLLAAARLRPLPSAPVDDREDRSDDETPKRGGFLAALQLDPPTAVSLQLPVIAQISDTVIEPAALTARRTVPDRPVQSAELAADTVAAARPAVRVREMAASTSTVRQTADAARTAKDGASEAKAVKLVSEQTKASKDTAKTAARQAGEQAKASKLAADTVKTTAKLAADQAKDAAEQARATKRATDEARAVKASADSAKAVKQAADNAREAKDAADAAKAAKEAADQAKAAKNSADQAKAAKDAAAQAKAAKDAAEQAKAAKDAAEQAKAAKDAAEQAKAAKDAAEQAKAAKDAANQAKAAKDAAKAAKDAAKATKDLTKGLRGG